MQFEIQRSQCLGAAIAAPFCPARDRGAAFFQGLGRSWNRVNGRADRADADTTAVVRKDRHDAEIKPESGWSPPSSHQLLRRVAVDRRISHTEPVRWLSQPNPWGRWCAAVMSLVIDHILVGFAMAATTLHREFLWRASEYPSRRGPAKDRPSARRADTAPTNFAGRRAWITSITSILTELRSRMLREREIRRIRAAWRAIDDRTLKDIGISRFEIEYAGDRRHWS
jgi:uncharacterized protein YjiS (DUF1127 family)